jgi:putative nucleotidyltransferase with HDIG domain
MTDTLVVGMNRLQVGLYIYLDLKWFDHPFPFSHFKIKDENQIKIIRSLGLQTVRYSPDLSDTDSTLASVLPATELASTVPVAVATEPSPAMQAKHVLMQQVQKRREAAERIEKAFINTAHTIRDIEKNLLSQPAQSLDQATKLIKQIADSILSSPDLAIQVMCDKMGGEELYFHSLNVTMLSMMMARDLKLPLEVAGPLGVGALLHDIGLTDVPDKILLKTEPLTSAERNFFELHTTYGVEIGRRMHLDAIALAIIGQHHEFSDGTGYPAKLKGDAIRLLARIVVIANYYDELCNPKLIADALTPHEALSLMFTKMRGKFDLKILNAFIRCLGVYPPGTIVQLSNGFIGMVTTVNTARPLKPLVVVYDADVPKEDMIILDMDTQSDLNIGKAFRPNQVPREVYAYLSPRKRVSYYFDASATRPQAGKP